MRKKIISFVFATMLGASLLVGCGGGTPKEAEDLVKESSEEVSQEERTVKVTEEASKMELKGELNTSSEISEGDITIEDVTETGE